MKSETLNMPLTDFSNRSNAATTEPKLLSLWENVVSKRNELNDKEYTLHDGPPYANGDVHLGHVLNKVLKDFFAKFYLMNGYKLNFRPGFDCHGLPTELAVQKKFGKLDKLELRNRCYSWAEEYSNKQRNTFKELGVFADWNNPYKTMSNEYELSQLNVLYKLLSDNYLFLENRPVYYSPSTQTVLAESELEYKDRTDTSVYFRLKSNKGFYYLAWTTQPWTVLANVAVCYNPKLEYVKVKYNNDDYVVSKNMAYYLFKGFEFTEFTEFDCEYVNELTNKSGKLVAASFVKDGTGSGLVHLAPAHGEDDYDVCFKYKLFGEDVTDNYGKLSNGLFCLDDGSKYVLDEMQKLNMVFKTQDVVHSYPHDWRTGKPVYFKLTEQVFLDLKDLKSKSLKSLDDVHFMDRNKTRFENFLKTRDRWCLSRQRAWGFPLAVFFSENKPFYSDELKNHLSSLFKTHGSNCWFTMSDNELLPESLHGLGLVKCEYTMDVWFDSGSSWASVLGDNKADLYLEGNDQHRGWFQSSLLLSNAVNNQPPFKNLLTHGFVLDENGKKMSKSLGNVVEPKLLQTKYNTDVLRLWVAYSDYLSDVTMSDRVMKSCSDLYFKFRNTLKYVLGNLYGFNEDFKHDLRDKDKDALTLLDNLHMNSLEFYKKGEFKKLLDMLLFTVTTFSSKYLDLETKSHLYEFSLDSDERQRCQYVLNYFFKKFTSCLAPLCPFLSEDAYQNYSFRKNESVFMEKF